MADTAEPSLTTSLSTSPGQKRKRTDQASPGDRRSKRGAPTATMTSAADNFIEAVEAAQAAAAAAANGVNVADFNALQQATVDHPEPSDAVSATSVASAAAAALGSMYPTLHVPQSSEETFKAQHPPSEEPSEDLSLLKSDGNQPHGLPTEASMGGLAAPANGIRGSESRYAPPPASSGPGPASHKPTVGSEEWHKMRKDNHKEVERRRRETINEGINELSKIVPGCEKNKGSILQRAVSFIAHLKENETANFEKWTLEKLLTEQAIAELSQSNDKLKQECERLYRELETWKSVAQNAGLQPPQAKEEASAART